MQTGSIGVNAGMAAMILMAKQAQTMQNVQMAVLKQSAESLQQVAMLIQNAGTGQQVNTYA